MINALRFTKMLSTTAEELKTQKEDFEGRLTRIKVWFSFVLIYVLIAVAGFAVYQFFNKMGAFIHCAWCTGGVLVIIGLFAISSAFVFGTQLENGFCMTSKIILNEPEYTQKNLFSSKFFEKPENSGYMTVLQVTKKEYGKRGGIKEREDIGLCRIKSNH